LEVVAVAVLAVADLVADSSVVAVSEAVDLEEDFDEKVLRSLRFKIIRF
jgi:Cdc6-like AAA superfamily ATPase